MSLGHVSPKGHSSSEGTGASSRTASSDARSSAGARTNGGPMATLRQHGQVTGSPLTDAGQEADEIVACLGRALHEEGTVGED